MIVDKMIEVSITRRNRKYYSEKGYCFLEDGKYWVNQLDIPSQSLEKILVRCDMDKCFNEDYIFSTKYYDNKKRNGGEYVCQNCARTKRYVKNIETGKAISFAERLISDFGENAISDYWADENELSPYRISHSSSSIKVFIKCQEFSNHIYQTTPNTFMDGHRCPYCSSIKVLRDESFAAKYPQYLKIFSPKNKDVSLFDFHPKSSSFAFLWVCENEKHEDYPRTLDKVILFDGRCPSCSRERKESFLQEKVRRYLEDTFDYILHEDSCSINPINPKTNKKLKYDNEVPDVKLVVEVMGIQHKFGWNKNNHDELEDAQWRDEFKKQHAINCGYHYLDIWYYDDDKEETWKKKIDQYLYDIGYFI